MVRVHDYEKIRGSVRDYRDTDEPFFNSEGGGACKRYFTGTCINAHKLLHVYYTLVAMISMHAE